LRLRSIITTQDGAKTLYVNSLGETYHSKNGALQEAEHVFIKNGIRKLKKDEINILELGFGTGLNVLVTLNEFIESNICKKINYFSIEKYPIKLNEVEELKYEELFENQYVKKAFIEIHSLVWGELEKINDEFYLKKIKSDFFELKNIELPPIDLVYFDCFASRVQPYLWEEDLLKIVSDKMLSGGLFTTYSSKGSVKRILKYLGFKVEKLAGPIGKREMINAWKI